MSNCSRIIIATLVALTGLEAAAHTRMTAPTPRTNEDGLKVGPCGNRARTNTPTALTPGQTLAMAWTETINHPGYYVIELSLANDANWVKLGEVADNQNQAGMHNFTTNVIIPNTPTQTGTLRIIQYMTENPNNPSLYYTCADVTIADLGGGVTIPTPPPPPPGGGENGSQEVGSNLPGLKGGGKMAGGCGLVAAAHAGKSSGGGMPPGTAAFLLLPLMAFAFLRRSQQLQARQAVRVVRRR